MEFRDVLSKRRSIRKFSNEPVDRITLQRIIDDAICAPSSGNEQPWRFIVLENKDLIRRISDDAKRNLLDRIEHNPSDYVAKYRKMLSTENFNIFYDAPTLVFVIGDGSLKNSLVNCSLAAGMFMMSAADRGLGTCWINFATSISSPELLETLNISENDLIVAPIAVGYPEVIPSIPQRNPAKIDFIS